MAARRVVLTGTWLVCCILHCPGMVLGSPVLYSDLQLPRPRPRTLHSLTSPLPTDTLYQPSRPFTYRASASVPQPSAYEFCAPQLSAKRRKPPQRRAPQASAPGAAKISMLRTEIILLGFHSKELCGSTKCKSRHLW